MGVFSCTKYSDSREPACPCPVETKMTRNSRNRETKISGISVSLSGEARYGSAASV